MVWCLCSLCWAAWKRLWQIDTHLMSLTAFQFAALCLTCLSALAVWYFNHLCISQSVICNNVLQPSVILESCSARDLAERKNELKLLWEKLRLARATSARETPSPKEEQQERNGYSRPKGFTKCARSGQEPVACANKSIMSTHFRTVELIFVWSTPIEYEKIGGLILSIIKVEKQAYCFTWK